MAVHESYRFQVKGRLGPEWSMWFEGLEVHNLPGGDTVLTGLVADQAALHGILRKISNLGLPLLCVCRVEDEPPGQEGPQI